VPCCPVRGAWLGPAAFGGGRPAAGVASTGCRARPPAGPGPVLWRVAAASWLCLAAHRPAGSISWAFPQAWAAAGLLLPGGIRLAPTLRGDGPHSGPLGGTPCPPPLGGTWRATRSPGCGDRAHWAEQWRPASSPGPCGSSVCASCAGGQARGLSPVFACAAQRCLRGTRSGCGAQRRAVSPRCNPLRTRRQVGGEAVPLAPEGRGVHPHGNGVPRPCGLAACLGVLPSFQPTGRTSPFVEG
jgi:hypothetical protein